MSDQPYQLIDAGELYKLVVDEEHFFLMAHHRRVAFYTGINTALLGLSGAGLVKADHWLTFLTLSLGPFALIFVSQIAIDSAFRFYQRFLIAVTMRGKLEHQLGLTVPISDHPFCPDESLIYPEHLESRKHSSVDFVRKMKNKGEHLQVIKLFNAFRYVGYVFLVLMIARSLLEFCNTIDGNTNNAVM